MRKRLCDILSGEDGSRASFAYACVMVALNPTLRTVRALRLLETFRAFRLLRYSRAAARATRPSRAARATRRRSGELA